MAKVKATLSRVTEADEHDRNFRMVVEAIYGLERVNLDLLTATERRTYEQAFSATMHLLDALKK